MEPNADGFKPALLTSMLQKARFTSLITQPAFMPVGQYTFGSLQFPPPYGTMHLFPGCRLAQDVHLLQGDMLTADLSQVGAVAFCR